MILICVELRHKYFIVSSMLSEFEEGIYMGTMLFSKSRASDEEIYVDLIFVWMLYSACTVLIKYVLVN